MSTIVPMKYAMFPGQQEALARRVAELRSEGQRWLSRRTVLGVGLGGFVGVTSGSLATLEVTAHALANEERRPSSRAPAEPSPELDWARELAVGTLEPLLVAQIHYATTMTETREIDEVLWVGVMRLTNAVVDGHPLVRPALVRLLVPLAERHNIPVVIRHLLKLVAAR